MCLIINKRYKCQDCFVLCTVYEDVMVMCLVGKLFLPFESQGKSECYMSVLIKDKDTVIMYVYGK